MSDRSGEGGTLPTGVRENLANHFGNLSSLLEEEGESESVDDAHSRAIELLSDLCEEDLATYEVPARRSRLAYADWLTRHGDSEDAEELYRELVSTYSSDLDGSETEPSSLAFLGPRCTDGGMSLWHG